PSMLNQNGVEVIIEMLANINLTRDLEHLTLHGRIVVVGSRGSLDFKPRLTMNTEADVLGMSIKSYTNTEFKVTMYAVSAMLESGQVKPFIGKSFSLEDASSAHQEVSSGDTDGNIVMTVH